VQGVGQSGHSVLGITANSAIGLLGLLLFINILRDVIAQVTGRRKRRDTDNQEEERRSVLQGIEEGWRVGGLGGENNIIRTRRTAI